MKRSVTFLLTLLLNVCFIVATAQSECEVLVPELQGEYSGRCKKGFANGKGIAKGIDRYEGNFKAGLPDGKGVYTWSTGEVYDGEWDQGMRDGIGVYWFTEDGSRLSEEGLWVEDRYKGPVPKPPRVLNSFNVFKYTFNQQGNGNTVRINLYLGSMDNTDLESFSITGTSGQEYTTGSTIGYENVTFPFICKVSYYTWNQLHSSRYYSSFEFQINDPGIWQVKIHNK